MRRAEARRAASIITKSSTRLSFTGGQVLCTMKISAPRTFSRSLVLTSPSGKRPTSARPAGTLRYSQISFVKAAFELPLKTLSSLDIVLLPLAHFGRHAQGEPALGDIA